jgi:hypothetical protein
MIEEGIFIKRIGKFGDIKKGWTYTAFHGYENDKRPLHFTNISIKEWDNHLILEKYSNGGYECLLGIEPLENIKEADKKSYNEALVSADNLYHWLNYPIRPDREIKIHDKTGNNNQLELKFN